VRPSVYDESSPLKEVVLGLAKDFGDIPNSEDCPDPKSLEHVINGTYPHQEALIREMTAVKDVLERYGVKVFRPHNIPGLNQIFARDITFVIEDKILIPNILKTREDELDGIEYILAHFEEDCILDLEEGIRAEGGDVMPWKDHLFIGYSATEDFDRFRTARTNQRAVDFMRERFPHREVKAIELVKSDTDPRVNALHLDCCFQPFGEGQAILYPAGMKHKEDVEYIIAFFGKENIIEVNQEEFYHMFPNIFSIDPKTIISNTSFTRLNTLLRERGFIVEEVTYNEVSKMGGLFRCSTLPLVRS
jgi:N-dimethylarginine dimethylaminohydrolase